MITNDNFVAAPDGEDLFMWYFVIFGLEGPFTNGYYMGKLIFPDNYPWSPPKVIMVSETGKFIVNASQCLSISEHHPESWDPTWTVRTLIIGVISFLLDEKASNNECLKDITVENTKQVA